LTQNIIVKKARPDAGEIYQLPGTRDWMDNSSGKHAYMCFPLAITNRLGWGISFPEDIVFIWDGIDGPSSEHVKVIKGEKYANSKRGNATLSFETGLLFRTDENTTMLTMPVPNQFIPGTQCFTTLISTSFYQPELPIAWKIMQPNQEITIPAGTPVAALLPISVSGLENNYTLTIDETYPTNDFWQELKKYGDAAQEKNGVGDWSKMYRNAVTYDGSSVGKHESKNIKLKTVTCPVTGATVETAD
jgi:hypothetical protein